MAGELNILDTVITRGTFTVFTDLLDALHKK